MIAAQIGDKGEGGLDQATPTVRQGLVLGLRKLQELAVALSDSKIRRGALTISLDRKLLDGDPKGGPVAKGPCHVLNTLIKPEQKPPAALVAIGDLLKGLEVLHDSLKIDVFMKAGGGGVHNCDADGEGNEGEEQRGKADEKGSSWHEADPRFFFDKAEVAF